jgi:Nickel responsive protein SCO4226-like
MADPIRSYLAECFWPGVTKAQLEELDSRVKLAATTGRDGTARVRYRGSMLMPDDEVVFCFFDGPSASAVEAAAREAGIPFARIVKSTSLPSPHPGEAGNTCKEHQRIVSHPTERLNGGMKRRRGANDTPQDQYGGIK